MSSSDWKRTRRFFPVIGICALALLPARAQQNILLIIADDFGADSCSLYNTNVVNRPKIPAMEALATNGVVFRNAYANPLCSPTRAGIITGRHSFRTGIGTVVAGVGSAILTTNEFTLPEAFAAGAPNYQLAHFGKWHLANQPTTPNTVGGWPLYVGNLIGALTNYAGWTKTSNGVSAGTTAYATTDLVNNASSWIAAQGTNRWFAWCAFNAPHTPFHKPPTNLCPDYAYLSGLQSDISTNQRTYFEAMVQSLDTELARLIASVNRTNTTIIFVGDNGTGAQAVPPQTPTNRSKGTLFEGGIHVPLIIAGPPVAGPGRTNTTAVNTVDLFATILGLAGLDAAAVVPTNVPLDSVSLLSILQNSNNAAGPRLAYSEVFGATISSNDAGQALRNDQFKLIRFGDNHDEFFDLLADSYEATNLLTNAMSAAQIENYNGLAFALGRYQQVFTNTITGVAPGSVTVQQNTNLAFTLWRAPMPSDNSWTPLTNALVATNGGSVTLTDANAPSSNALYSVMGKPR